MKKLSVLFLIIFAVSIVNGQTKGRPDQDRITEYLDNQQYTEALKYIESYENHHHSRALQFQLGYANLMAGKLAEADNIYTRLYSRDSKSLPVLFKLAAINTKRGNEIKAEGYYREIIAIDSSNYSAYKQLAGLYPDESNPDKIKYLEMANTFNPLDADVITNLCEFYFKTDSFKKAEEILEPAIKADSANLRLLKMRMPISIAAKRYTDAIETGNKVLSDGDSSSFVVRNLADAYFLQNDYRNALNYYLMTPDGHTDKEALWYRIALCYRGIRDYKNAVIYLNKTITEGTSLKMASYYGLLGDSYEYTSENDKAEAAYKRGLLFNNNGSLYYKIAYLYENRFDDKKNALVYYNLYLKNFKYMNKNPRLATFIKNKIEELKK